MARVQTSTHPEKRKTDPHLDMESLVGYILLGGVLSSVALLAIGFVWRWVRSGNLQFQHTVAGMNFFEFTLSSLRQMASHDLRPRVLVNLGIAVLMLTPFVRVLASVFYFVLVLTYSLFLR